MDLFIIEIVCWGGLLFFFWALKDGLSRVEADIESIGILPTKRFPGKSGPAQFSKPEHVEDRIGSYRDEPIYRYVVISGRTYQFDRVLPTRTAGLSENERCIAPGLVYLECQPCESPAAQA